MNYDEIKENIFATYQIAKSRNWFIESEFLIDIPATIEEINKLEISIGKKLPNQLKDLLLNMSKSVNLYYQIEEEIPSEFKGIFSGEFCYDLKLLKYLNKHFNEWILASLDEDTNDVESIEITEQIKDNKTVFLKVSTGDLIAVDDETNKVIYFDHEGDTMHGKILASDLNTFLEQWSQMGFFGTEGWQFEVMYDFDNNKLKSLNDEKVINWINWLEMKTNQ